LLSLPAAGKTRQSASGSCLREVRPLQLQNLRPAELSSLTSEADCCGLNPARERIRPLRIKQTGRTASLFAASFERQKVKRFGGPERILEFKVGQ